MNALKVIKFRFSPQSGKSRKVLGPLEGEIMDVMWEGGARTVGDVHRALSAGKEIAYTTVMTTMSRLAKKHLLTQDRSSTTYRYTPVLNRSDFERYVSGGIIAGLFEDYGDSVIDYFVECVRDLGPAQRAHLRKLVCGEA